MYREPPYRSHKFGLEGEELANTWTGRQTRTYNLRIDNLSNLPFTLKLRLTLVLSDVILALLSEYDGVPGGVVCNRATETGRPHRKF